jgi:ribonuclease D
VDTEFVRDDSYYPKPCLIQIGNGQEDVCVDTIALDASALKPLFATLASTSVVKVFHSASQDLELFVQLTGDCPRPLFDTQLAASLLGEGDQLGYAALVERRLGVKLDKSLTRTDWSRRPLSAAELAYAAADVRYLAQLYPQLRDELAAAGRLVWLEEDCTRLTDPQRYFNPPEEAWRRLKGIGRLEASAQRVAAELASWREIVAQQRNRPRKWILEDEPLYRLAERRPRSEEQLADLKLLPPKTLSRHGSALLEVIAGVRHDAHPLAEEDPPLIDTQKAKLQKLQEWLRQRAASLNIPPSLLAPRADVEAIVRRGGEAGVPLLEGWRAEVAGSELLKIR